MTEEELKAQITLLENRICNLKRKNASLENKVEKMKCAENCKHYWDKNKQCEWERGRGYYICNNWECVE